MSKIKLKPCRHCGGKAKIHYDYHDFALVQCSKCGISTLHRKDKEDAIREWNNNKPMERIVERVEAARQKYQRLCKEQGEKEDEAMNIIFRGVIRIVQEEGVV